MKPGRRAEGVIREVRRVEVGEHELSELERRPELLGVGVLIWRDGKFLLIREAKGERRSHWLMVGGEPRPGEAPECAAIREAREEVGLRLSAVKLAKAIELVFSSGSRSLTKRFLIFEATAPRGARIRRGRGVTAAKWFSRLPRRLLYAQDFEGLIG